MVVQDLLNVCPLSVWLNINQNMNTTENVKHGGHVSFQLAFQQDIDQKQANRKDKEWFRVNVIDVMVCLVTRLPSHRIIFGGCKISCKKNQSHQCEYGRSFGYHKLIVRKRVITRGDVGLLHASEIDTMSAPVIKIKIY